MPSYTGLDTNVWKCESLRKQRCHVIDVMASKTII